MGQCLQSDGEGTPYSQIEQNYTIPTTKLHEIRRAFVHEMGIGLSEDDRMLTKNKKSSLKMLSSHVRSIPDGTEQGVFYTLDWGGSNYRVLRIEFSSEKGSKPICNEFKIPIPTKYKQCNSSDELFDHLAQHVADKLTNDNADKDTQYRVGFTFSFPMAQPALNSGILVEWTKGFDIPDVVGQDVVALMHKAFDRHNINAKIHAVCNDTVGTLLACAYDHENVRVGLILGTGSNACYIEPDPPNKHDDEKDNVDGGEIINMEWGGFCRLLPRMHSDLEMDKHTPNPGVQYAEKMISGYYLGELVRLVAIEVFGESIIKYGDKSPLNVNWRFESKTVSGVLGNYYDNNLDGILDILRGEKGELKDFSKEDADIFGKICVLMVNRSADLSATLLLGTMEKTGLFVCDEKDDKFELRKEYKENGSKIVTVGIDGSVFLYVPRYQERMEQTISNIVGKEIAERIKLVRSSDGSGKGAALAVAATMH